MYRLPSLNIHPHVIDAANTDAYDLFGRDASTLTEQRNARRGSIVERVAECASMVNASGETWIIWCDLNDEGDALERMIPGSVQIQGSDDIDYKEAEILRFAQGGTRVLITKPKIAGFGLNLQVCHNMAYVGVSNSFEAYYQSVRRCWRFGQKHQVNVHVFSSKYEGRVVDTLKRKENDAKAMYEGLSVETRQSVMESVLGSRRQSNEYQADRKITLPQFMVKK
jgi:superfamily II DNA or RNA helicase